MLYIIYNILFIPFFLLPSHRKKKKYINKLYFNKLMKKIDYQEYNNVIIECSELSKKKNANYGTDGLKRFGVNGIVCRISDKNDRLINLTWNKQEDLNNESIEDTCKDMINYLVYVILMQRNKLEE